MRETVENLFPRITLSPKAKAQAEKSFIERTIAEAWSEVEGHLPCYEARAEFVVGSLEEAGFQIVRKPTAGRVVVLDEAGERKLQDLLSGKSVPTGRIVEVTYRNPDGSTRTQRHAEFGSLDKVSYDPPPVLGAEVAGATVLKATETVGQDADLKVQLARMGLVHGAIVHADGSITPLDKDAMDAGVAAVGEKPFKGCGCTQKPKETVEFNLTAGLIAELPAGTEIGWPTPLVGNARAVRDLVTARDLIARAAAVLGNDACDEILNNLADPADQSEAA